jgi:hypothetical protein
MSIAYEEFQVQLCKELSSEYKPQFSRLFPRIPQAVRNGSPIQPQRPVFQKDSSSHPASAE